jgi:hypothetical protein
MSIASPSVIANLDQLRATDDCPAVALFLPDNSCRTMRGGTWEMEDSEVLLTAYDSNPILKPRSHRSANTPKSWEKSGGSEWESNPREN